jgi:uncharacterized protein with GYD domain
VVSYTFCIAPSRRSAAHEDHAGTSRRVARLDITHRKRRRLARTPTRAARRHQARAPVRTGRQCKENAFARPPGRTRLVAALHARHIATPLCEGNMATYIMLVNWTDQGIRSVKDTVKRAKAFREVAQGLGATLGSFKWTLGAYDLVVSFDCPDDETATRVGLVLGTQGNVRTSTLRAFSEDEMERILAGMK